MAAVSQDNGHAHHDDRRGALHDRPKPEPEPEPTRSHFDPFPPFPRSSTEPEDIRRAGQPLSAGLSPTSPLYGSLAGVRQDRSRLAPEDAFHAQQSPVRDYQRSSAFPPFEPSFVGLHSNNNSTGNLHSNHGARRSQDEGSRSRSSRGHRRHRSSNRSGKRSSWKKLLWVKQSYPDNYTDQNTFLENLQRNPRLQPYDFWPLVSDSTVIVQHVCSVIIFVVCFVGIFQERISPVAVVTSSTIVTGLGWILWERWDAEAEAELNNATEELGAGGTGVLVGASRRNRAGTISRRNGSIRNRPPQMPLPRMPPAPAPAPAPPASSSSVLGSKPIVTSPSAMSPPYPSATSSATNPSSNSRPRHSHAGSASSLHSVTSATTSKSNDGRTTPMISPSANISSSNVNDMPTAATATVDPFPSRGHQRLGTIKSAVLIYSTLLGMSPILKSLTRSTSSDSIWAMSFWLLAINIFSFDYATTETTTARVPASLSTNAALMASTVLASRLPSTRQVFSLTLFSIEVFGLFPVFRRAARFRATSGPSTSSTAQQPPSANSSSSSSSPLNWDAWWYHYAMTAALVWGAGAGIGIIAGDGAGYSYFPWKRALVGMLISSVIAALAMGGCSWWLIGLQKYKNEIYGPWDPARPIIISRRAALG